MAPWRLSLLLLEGNQSIFGHVRFVVVVVAVVVVVSPSCVCEDTLKILWVTAFSPFQPDETWGAACLVHPVELKEIQSRVFLKI